MERRGIGGWVRRALGIQASYDPAVAPMDVRIIGDESDLVAAMHGPRGMCGTRPTPFGDWTGAAPGEFTAFLIRAGQAGVHVWLSWELDSAGDRAEIFTTPGRFGVDVPDLITEQEIPIRWAEPAFQGTSKAFIGNHLGGVAVPWEAWNFSGTPGSTPLFTVGLWLAPGRVLWCQQEAEDPGAFYFRAWLEEPGSPPSSP